MKRWGKAGVRLTGEEIRRRGYGHAAASQAAKLLRGEDEAVARQLWAAGQVKPYRITLALNAKALYGPEVDVACGAREPDVDLWEAGERYPTWDQLLALAHLCGVTPRFLCIADTPFPIDATSMRFHRRPESEPEPPIVWAFKPAAVAKVVTA